MTGAPERAHRITTAETPDSHEKRCFCRCLSAVALTRGKLGMSKRSRKGPANIDAEATGLTKPLLPGAGATRPARREAALAERCVTGSRNPGAAVCDRTTQQGRR